MSLWIIFAIIFLLIIANGFYVAAEFSTVSAKRARLAQLADQGNPSARTILTIVSDPHKLDAYIAATQVGITLTSLVLGFYGRSAILEWAEPSLAALTLERRLLVESAVSVLILLVLTVLQVILGELIPKNVGLQYPEGVALWTALPMRWSQLFFAPLIWLFNGSGRLILRLFSTNAVAEHAHVHSPEEIVLLVEESSEGGVLDQEERRLLVNTLQLRNQIARKVMVPRNQVLAASVDEDSDALFNLLANSPYSRLPLYEESIDKIVGIVHLKDLLALRLYNGEQSVRAVMHPPLFVPDSVTIEEVIKQMQRAHKNVAIVVDEYGGTAGLLAFEDLVEEIIGDFEDEFDAVVPGLRLLKRNQLMVRGDLHIDEFNDLIGTQFRSDAVDTLGGLVTSKMGKIPIVGEEIIVDGTRICVEKMDQHRVAEVRVELSPEQVARLERRRNE